MASLLLSKQNMQKFFFQLAIVLAFIYVSTPASAQDVSEGHAQIEEEQLTPEDTNYNLRMRELEDRVNDLKEEIFRSKSRLFLLRQQILQDNIGGSRIVITHNNLMSSRFSPIQVVYSLDGNIIYSATNATEDIPDSVEVFSDSVIPGPHNLSVQIVLQGHGYGLVSYMRGYQFDVMNSQAFNVEEGETIIMEVVAFENGGMNQPLEERPALRFDSTSTSTTGDVATMNEDE